jgi:hypothetical protein
VDQGPVERHVRDAGRPFDEVHLEWNRDQKP